MTRPLILIWSIVRSTILPVMLTLLMFGFRVPEAHGQEQFDTETQPATDDLVPCPPGFRALYTDPVRGRFAGWSNLTMVQDDQYHRYKFYTYEFRGKSQDGKTAIRGTHHVNAFQCFDANVQWLLNIPGEILTLHNAQFTSLACGGFGGGEPVASIAFNCEDSDGDGPGGPGDGGGTLRCYTVQIDHYWYYPDTGATEYRYSELYTWCEDAT
jgi:hypothetical protein